MNTVMPVEGVRVLNRAGRERSLIEAAGKLFAAQGYEATTTRQIAAQAGCAEGLISRYFKGKAGLLKALIQVHFDEEVEEFRDDSPPAANLGEEVIRRIDWDVDHIYADFDFLRVVIPRVLIDMELGQELESMGPGRHERLITERLAMHEKFRSMPEEEREALAHLVSSIGLGYGFWAVVRGEKPPDAKRKAMTIARILARGL
jgi:AcrR family transcriptional regulator